MSVEEILIETDVLIVGGSVAGEFAAISAKKENPELKVLVVDKAYASKSGGGGIAGGWFIAFNPKWGHDIQAWTNYALDVGEYINNRDWLEIQLKESYARLKDLISWGAPINEEKGQPKLWHYGPVLDNVRFDSRKYLPPVRKKATQLGVEFLDRVMITELIKQDGKIVGALGFDTNEGNFYDIRSKAVILSAGCGGYKTPGFMGDFRSSDAESAGYRAGAALVSKEFGGKEGTAARHFPNTFCTTGTIIAKHYLNAENEDFMPRYLPINSKYGGWQSEVQTRNSWLLEVDAGRGPIYWNLDGVTPEEAKLLAAHRILLPRAHIADQLGVNIEKGKLDIVGGCSPGENGRGKGGLLIDLECKTNLPGLYAAGDDAGSMTSGSSYISAGWAFPHAAVTGNRAGRYAAIYAAKEKKTKVDKSEIERLQRIIYSPLNRKGGFTAEWVLDRLQNIMAPYYVLQVKSGERLQAALTFANFINDRLIPKLVASDPHELRMANEVRNMTVNAQMNLAASIFRTESRGGHIREDYPKRDDPNWLAWVILKQVDGEMKLSKKPLPKAWWPDLNIPYTKRYEYRIPGEEIK